MKKINMANVEKKNFVQKSRHVRWNWEKSPKSFEGNELIRYHFVIQDDKYRKGKMERILENINEKSIINYSFEEKNRLEGKAVGTDYRYLFVSYDTKAPFNYVTFEGVSKNVKRDINLVERIKKGCSIKNYVIDLYEKK